MDYLERLYLARICPACGFRLSFTPWATKRSIDQPCPSCGLHFGVDDAKDDRKKAYEDWQRRWVQDGARWWSRQPAPSDFDAQRQLARLHELVGKTITFR